MRRSNQFVLAVLAVGSAGCSAESEGVVSFGAMSYEDHLRCAAQISSYDRLIASGQVERDPGIVSASLPALMTHLNAYAIPQMIAEPEAFAALNKLREDLVAAQSPDTLLSATLACIESANLSGA